jgi:hypothetical protein
MILEKYFCQKCDTELERHKRICPKCGCTNIFVKKNLEGVLILKGFRRIRGKLIGFKKFAIEILKGWQPSKDKKKHPKGVSKYRVINKKGPTKEDSYQEIIVDEETGKICRNIKEPLYKHRNKQGKKN